MKNRWLAIAAIFIAGTFNASANGQNGIAFVYAPEAAMGVCAGPTPEAAFGCARDKCVAAGGAASECANVAWCMPAGWSASISVMHKEGIHWSEFTCGWPTKEAALAAGKLRCDTQNKEFVQECIVGGTWDENAQEFPAE